MISFCRKYFRKINKKNRKTNHKDRKTCKIVRKVDLTILLTVFLILSAS